MNRRSFKLISVVAVFLIAMFALTRAARAEPYVYTTIDAPNALNCTWTCGINDNGDVVGYYLDRGGLEDFIYNGGQFTVQSGDMTSESSGYYAYGINDDSDVVGYYGDSIGFHGFLYSGGVLTIIDDSSAGTGRFQGTEANGINDNDDIVGYYIDSSGNYHGFLYSGTAPHTYTTIDDPKGVGTYAWGVNDSDDVVGYYIDGSGNYHGFWYSGSTPHTYTTIDVPNAFSTQAYGINDSGDIVGSYQDSNGRYGFLYNSSTQKYTTIGDPNDFYNTQAFGINDSGRIVGYYGEGEGIDTTHGFLATPQPLLQNARSLGSGWYWSSWFDYFYTDDSPWVYHKTLGWLYPFGTSLDSVWLYDLSMNAFLWTSATDYPYFYRARDGAWLWYEERTSNPCWFYNFKTKKWEKD